MLQNAYLLTFLKQLSCQNDLFETLMFIISLHMIKYSVFDLYME